LNKLFSLKAILPDSTCFLNVGGPCLTMACESKSVLLTMEKQTQFKPNSQSRKLKGLKSFLENLDIDTVQKNLG
jgi:hypothetical protein